jgi:uncharacterized protein (TIGR02266 family)
MTSQGQDKRLHPRVPLLLRIDYPGAPGFRDATENLSAGGLFIRTDRILAIGERVPLVVSFPGLLQPLELEVEVAWARPAGGGVPAGLAVRIPASRADERELLASLARSAAVPGLSQRTVRLLVVEDNSLVVAMYEAALKRLAADGLLGLSLEYAHDGVEALARLGSRPLLDLVITDLYMPVMDGFTLVERVRHDPEIGKTPILAISAGGDEARSRAVDLGVDLYLQKPVKMADILTTVRALLHLG